MNTKQCKECKHLTTVKPLTDCSEYPGRYPGPQSVIKDCKSFDAALTLRDIQIIVERVK